MSDHDFTVQQLEGSVDQIAEAMTSKARELNVIPLGCQYRCRIEIGSDGKPNYICEIIC